MNNYELVAAVQYLLEARQGKLMEVILRPRLNKVAASAIQEELNEIEYFVEKAREGYTE